MEKTLTLHKLHNILVIYFFMKNVGKQFIFLECLGVMIMLCVLRRS